MYALKRGQWCSEVQFQLITQIGKLWLTDEYWNNLKRFSASSAYLRQRVVQLYPDIRKKNTHKSLRRSRYPRADSSVLFLPLAFITDLKVSLKIKWHRPNLTMLVFQTRIRYVSYIVETTQVYTNCVTPYHVSLPHTDNDMFPIYRNHWSLQIVREVTILFFTTFYLKYRFTVKTRKFRAATTSTATFLVAPWLAPLLAPLVFWTLSSTAR